MGTIHIVQEGFDPRSAGRVNGAERALATGPKSTTGNGGAIPATAPAPAAERPTIDPELAIKFAQEVQQALERVAPTPHEVVFRRDEATNGFVIEVRNPDGSVVRQYPPEKLLNLRRKLDEMSGMVIDEMT